jgi:peptidoglycan/xylan/chitin deacetylase (PgdA/CDA1 family)
MFVILLIGMLLTGCSSALVVANVPTHSLPPLPSETATLTPFMAVPNTPTLTITLTPTATSTPTMTPSPTPLPSATPTATWMFNEAGKVTAPILLYHHVADIEPTGRYYISPAIFEQQLAALKQWGYTAVTISSIVDALTKGADLPARPVVITFDDGDADVYQNAFPIMQKYGFVGTFYLVGLTLNARSIVTSEQVGEMITAGWEIGSHSMSHIDLTQNHDAILYEAGTSKANLSKELNVKVNTFSYPYGLIDPFVVGKVIDYGYKAGVGLGESYVHTWNDLYYLNRLEVQSSYDMDKFASLLPWHDQP